VKRILPVIVLAVYFGSALLVQFHRISTPSPPPWGPLLPIMTPLAWLLCTMSLRPYLRFVPAALTAAVGVCLTFILYFIVAGTWWGS